MRKTLLAISFFASGAVILPICHQFCSCLRESPRKTKKSNNNEQRKKTVFVITEKTLWDFLKGFELPLCSNLCHSVCVMFVLMLLTNLNFVFCHNQSKQPGCQKNSFQKKEQKCLNLVLPSKFISCVMTKLSHVLFWPELCLWYFTLCL